MRVFLGEFDWKDIKREFDKLYPAGNAKAKYRLPGEQGPGAAEGNLLAAAWVAHESGAPMTEIRIAQP